MRIGRYIAVSASGSFTVLTMHFPPLSRRHAAAIQAALDARPDRFPLQITNRTGHHQHLLLKTCFRPSMECVRIAPCRARESIYDFTPAPVPKLRLKSLWKRGPNFVAFAFYASDRRTAKSGKWWCRILSAFCYVFSATRGRADLCLHSIELSFRKGTPLGWHTFALPSHPNRRR